MNPFLQDVLRDPLGYGMIALFGVALIVLAGGPRQNSAAVFFSLDKVKLWSDV